MTTPSKATNVDDIRDERSELSGRELRELEQLLIAEREAVQRRLHLRFEDAADHPASLADAMDQASKDQEQGHVLRLADKEFNLLRAIAHGDPARAARSGRTGPQRRPREQPDK
jgi:hypothetical protein